MAVRIIQLYAGEAPRPETEFSNEYYLNLCKTLELQLANAGGSATAPTGGLLETQIKLIEQQRDDARQELAKAKSEITKLKASGGGKGTLSDTEEIVKWEKIDTGFAGNAHLIRKWRIAGFDALTAEDWISRGIPIDQFSLAKYLRDVRTVAPNDWVKADAAGKKTHTDEYEKVNTVDTTKGAFRYSNWGDIPTKTPGAFNLEKRQKWETLCGFNFGETWQWIENGMTEEDYGFCAWIRDEKGKTDANYRDPEWVVAHTNIGKLRADYNKYVVANKHGTFKITPTDIVAVEASVNRKIDFTINAGAITLSNVSVVQNARLTNLTGWAAATHVHLLYNTTHASPAPTPDPEKAAYDVMKIIANAKYKNKPFTIGVIDADQITVNGNAVEIRYGTFDSVDVVGHAWSVPASLTAKNNNLIAMVKARATNYGVDLKDLDANAKANGHWDNMTGDNSRPASWEDFVKQIIYDKPNATVASKEADFNYSSVSDVVWAGLTEYVVDLCCGQNGLTAPGNAQVLLQRYVDENRSPTDLAYYNKHEVAIKGLGVSIKEKKVDWGKVLGDIKTFFDPTTPRTLADIRAEGKKIKDTYIDPLDGINLAGAKTADKLSKNIKSTSSAGLIIGAKDHTRNWTDSSGKSITSHYFSSNENYSEFYTPVNTAGGGNCWLHSFNIHLTGNNDGKFITKLRAAACLEMMTNQDWMADPNKPDPILEKQVAGAIREYLMDRKVMGQDCRMAYEGDWWEAADANFFSKLLSRPIVVAYRTDGKEVRNIVGDYHIASLRQDDKDLAKKFTHKEPWHIWNINSGHFEALIRHEDHRELTLSGKTKDVKIVEADNKSGKRAIVFDYTKTNLKESGGSTATKEATEITALNIKDVESITFDFSATDATTQEHFDSLLGMITDGKNLNTVDKKTNDWEININDYKKIDTTTITGGLKIVPRNFGIRLLK